MKLPPTKSHLRIVQARSHQAQRGLKAPATNQAAALIRIVIPRLPSLLIAKVGTMFVRMPVRAVHSLTPVDGAQVPDVFWRRLRMLLTLW